MQRIDPSRRRLMMASLAALGLAAVARPQTLQSATRFATPPQTRGPFYPLQFPLDSDNDLVSVQGRTGIARGQIVNVVGRVLDARGRPVRGARIEIWQCDAYGRYAHPGDRRDTLKDPNFQGYGQFVTDGDGAYRFRTIKPVPYPSRAPHIHFSIRGPHFEPLITQMYVEGAPENERDWILNRIEDPHARQSLIVSFLPSGVAANDELVGNFDIILAMDGRFDRP